MVEPKSRQNPSECLRCLFRRMGYTGLIRFLPGVESGWKSTNQILFSHIKTFSLRVKVRTRLKQIKLILRQAWTVETIILVQSYPGMCHARCCKCVDCCERVIRKKTEKRFEWECGGAKGEHPIMIIAWVGLW